MVKLIFNVGSKWRLWMYCHVLGSSPRVASVTRKVHKGAAVREGEPRGAKPFAHAETIFTPIIPHFIAHILYFGCCRDPTVFNLVMYFNLVVSKVE